MTIDEAITTEIEYSQPCDIICKDGADCNDCRSYHRQLVEWLEELKQYRAIGTPEECRAAIERQNPRAAITEKEDIGTTKYTCPACGMYMGWSTGLFPARYCWKCGQKLDWSNGE